MIGGLIEYSKKRHAEVVYRKCLRNKKYKLASKIKTKYRLSNRDDRVVSFGLALAAFKRKEL